MRVSRLAGFGMVAVVAIGAFAVAVLALPRYAAERANRGLAALGPYTGHVDAARWDGRAIVFDGLVIEKRGVAAATPWLTALRVRIEPHHTDAGWRARAVFEGATLQFVAAPGARASQSGHGVAWQRALESLTRIPVDTLRLDDATFAFRDTRVAPPVELALDRVDAALTNLDAARGGRARAMLRGRFAGAAPLTADARFDANPPLEALTLALDVAALDAARLNAATRAYADLDFERGRGDFSLRLVGRGDRLDGTATARLADVDVFDFDDDVGRGRGLRRALRELGAGIALKLRARDDGGRVVEPTSLAGSWPHARDDTFAALLDTLRIVAARGFGIRFADAPPVPARAPGWLARAGDGDADGR